MRYPRNNCFPTEEASVATLLLSTVTVLHASSSSAGLDPWALVLAAGSIAGLFGLIAAPAVDVLLDRPDISVRREVRSAVGYLARYADHAGIWLALAAIVAGYALSNPRLQGVMAAALLIESAWFLRQRWGYRQRRLYPISGNDLDILNRRANGDIAEYARRHRVRELVVSDGAVGWLGCTKKKRPCPVKFYVDYLGLDLPPCCREHLERLCHDVARWLTDMGAVHWLDGGTLLGAVRESGRLNDWEDDIDISVLLDGAVTWESLAARLSDLGPAAGYYVNTLRKRHKIAVSYDRPRPWPFRWERNRMRGENRLDLHVYWHAVSRGRPVLDRGVAKAAMPSLETGGYGVPADMVLPTSTIRFLDGEYSCPNRPEAYLNALYGDFRESIRPDPRV